MDQYLLKWWTGGYTHRYASYNYTPENTKEHAFEQVDVLDKDDLIQRIIYSNNRNFGSFISVNSFINGHPKNNPYALVEYRTFFGDFDVEGDEWKNDDKTGTWNKFNAGKVGRKEVVRVRNKLLMESIQQAQSYVSYMYENGIVTRQVLTAFKGVHVFVDFKPKILTSEVGSKAIQLYFTNMVEGKGFAIDTVNFDSARLCRIANSYNPKASSILSGGATKKYCVPVTVEELMSIDSVSDYDNLCDSPRVVDFGNTVNSNIDIEAFKEASELMVKNEKKASEAFKQRRFGPSQLPSKIWREQWRSESYKYYTFDDVLRYIKPCAKYIIDNNMFTSHRIRVFVATELLHVGIPGLRVPLSMIHEIFKHTNDYNYDATQYQLEHLGRNEYDEWKYFAIKKEIPYVDSMCVTCPQFNRCHTIKGKFYI